MAILSAVVVAALAVAEPGGAARVPDLRFGHLTIDDGLSRSWVYSVLRDSRGFLWVGTRGGLDRYDGERVVSYAGRSSGAGGLGDIIRALFEDSKGQLWVSTEAGLLRYDRTHDRFERISLGDNPGENLVNQVVEDQAGGIWAATANGLATFDPATGSVRRLRASSGDPGALPSNVLNAILVSRSGRVWFGTDSAGVGFIDPGTSRVTRLPLATDPRSIGQSFTASALHEDQSGRIWVATLEHGVIQLDASTGAIVAHHVPEPGRPGSIGTRRVRAFASDAKGLLYVGTENGGLEVLDVASGRFRRFMPRRGDDSSLSSSSVYGMTLDRQGILWIATFNGGLSFTSPSTQRFRTLRAIREDELADPHVAAILEDDRGDLWVGTDGGGLDRFERSTGRVTRFRHDLKNPQSIGSDAVIALIQDRQGSLWVAGWDSDLMLLDRASGRVTRYPLAEGYRNVMGILEDGPDELLLASGRGVVVFDRRTHSARPLAERVSGLVPNFCSMVTRDSRGRLWIATGAGATVVEPGGKVRNLSHDPKEPSSLASGSVLAIREDSKRNLWFGSEGGLTLLTPSGEMRRYGSADGLPGNSVKDVVEDGEGNLWLSTDRGLARVAAASVGSDHLRIVTFDLADGLQGSDFKQGTAIRSRSGELFFGGQKGLTRFFPRDVLPNPEAPPVVFTGLRLANRLVTPGEDDSPLETSMTESKALTLSHRQNVLTFEFAALNLLAPSKNRYKYRLEGFEDQWNDVGGQATASYAGLPPGRYTLRVQASNNDGVWNEQGASLAVRIRPPWWKHWLFLSFAFLAAAIALGYGYRWRVRNMEERRRELEGLVAQRTGELEASAEDLKRQGEALARENDDRRRAEAAARHAAERVADSYRDLERQRGDLEREVGERQKAEEEAGRERDLLHALMDNAPDLIYFKDTTSRFTRVNQAMARNLGLQSPAEAVGKSDFDFLVDTYARAARGDEERLFSSGKPLVGHVEHDTKRDLWYQSTKVPLRDSRGSVSGLVGISVDITERKRAEERLGRELAAFLTFVDTVAQGDLSLRGKEGEETLGRIARGVNAMLSSFGGILTSVRDTIHSVSSSSMEILAASTEISKGAEHGSDQVQDTLVAVEEMAASMIKVSRDADASASAAHRVLDHVREGESAVNAAHEGMARIDAAVAETAEKMRLLDRRSREVFEVIDFIQEIASQSELLSLNAAIQAAHAGEAGRGFSVVADEIRRLAERSRKATRDVSGIVEGIVEEIRAAIEAMGIALSEVQAERELSDRARGALGEIGGLVDDSATRASQISFASQEQAQTTRAMAEAMQSLASITTESAAGARETAKSVAHLVRLSEDLDQAVARFRLG